LVRIDNSNGFHVELQKYRLYVFGKHAYLIFCMYVFLRSLGDWGTQFGMLITFLKEHYPEFKQQGSDVDISDLTKFYKMAKVGDIFPVQQHTLL